MEQQRSLAAYAQSLDISPASLHAIITAQLADVEPDALDRLADLYHQSRDTLSDHVSFLPPQESFAVWLKRNMEGISQHALRTRAQLDSKTLKQFLNGKMLPDSDQSERLARTLYIDRTELARVVTATMIHQAATEHVIDSASVPADRVTRSLAIAKQQEPIPSPRTRRPKATSHTRPTSAEGIVATGDTTTTDIVRKPQGEPKADNNGRPVGRRQATTKTVASPAQTRTHSPIQAAPVSEVEHANQPTADRQAGMAAAVASERTTISPVGAMLHRDKPAEVVTGSGRGAARKASAQRSERGQRRSANGAKSGAADATAGMIRVPEEEALAGQAAIEHAPAHESAAVAAAVPTVVAPPTERVMERGAPAAPDQSSPARSTSEATVKPTTKATPAANTPPPAPSTTSTAQASTSAIMPAIHADDIVTLQLSADEVRLIRHWRQLHPHGRRATLYYIGSLLVED